jgi:enterochelin esterase-like enzyme
MIKRFAFTFILISGLTGQSFSIYPQSNDDVNNEIKGTVKRSLSFFSKTGNENVNYSVYLPPDYTTSQDSFPVFYLLHGLGGNENSWINDFLVHQKTDSLIGIGAIPPLIIIMPDGRRSYYINDYRDDFPYETIFIKEFIPYIDSLYKTKGRKPFRVIGGLSMGGYGALINCFRHPEYFSAAIALSAAVRTDSMIINENAEKYEKVFKPLFGDSIQQYKLMTSHWRENNPLYLTGKHPDTLRTIHWFLDCGLSDYLFPGNEALHDLFIKYQIPHEFHVRSGGHERAYWESGLVPALLFMGRILQVH